MRFSIRVLLTATLYQENTRIPSDVKLGICTITAVCMVLLLSRY